MEVVADTSVASSKLPATLLIVPDPETFVALKNVIPSVLRAVSSKPTAPVTVVESADPNPLNAIPPAVPALPEDKANARDPMPVIDPPVDEVALPVPVGAVEKSRLVRFVRVPSNVIAVPTSARELALASTEPSVQLIVPPPPPPPAVASTTTSPPPNAASRSAVLNVDVLLFDVQVPAAQTTSP